MPSPLPPLLLPQLEVEVASVPEVPPSEVAEALLILPSVYCPLSQLLDEPGTAVCLCHRSRGRLSVGAVKGHWVPGHCLEPLRRVSEEVQPARKRP